MMNIELLATCSALGYLDGDEYHKESDCLGQLPSSNKAFQRLLFFFLKIYSIL